MMRAISLLLASLIASVALAGPNTATLTWGAVTLNEDGSPVATPLAYNVYQGASGAESKTTSTSLTTLTISGGLASNSTVCWYVTAVDANGMESAPSAEACKSFPATRPSAPTSLIVR